MVFKHCLLKADKEKGSYQACKIIVICYPMGALQQVL